MDWLWPWTTASWHLQARQAGPWLHACSPVMREGCQGKKKVLQLKLPRCKLFPLWKNHANKRSWMPPDCRIRMSMSLYETKVFGAFKEANCSCPPARSERGEDSSQTQRMSISAWYRSYIHSFWTTVLTRTWQLVTRWSRPMVCKTRPWFTWFHLGHDPFEGMSCRKYVSWDERGI